MKRKSRNEKRRKWQQRRARVRKAVDLSDRTWLTVYRSAKHIYAQLIDPTDGRTIASASTRTKAVIREGQTGNIDAAKKVGTAIALIAKEKHIERVVFNRNGFLYHGRVKALVEAAREAGLQL